MLQISTKSTAQFLSDSYFKNGSQKQKFPIWKIPIQNDRVYAPHGSQKRQVSAECLLRTRSTFSKSVMVSVAVSLHGTTELMFIEPSVKINGAYYRDVLLGQHLLPAIRSVAGDFFTYNAPAHRAGDIVEFLSPNTPDFITLLPWPPNSPDLSPVEVKCGACSSNASTIAGFATSTTWKASHRGVALLLPERHDRAVRQWRVRLRACVRANGGHFEQKL